MLNRYNFASSSFEFSTFLSSRNAKKIALQSSFPSFALKWGYSAGLHWEKTFFGLTVSYWSAPQPWDECTYNIIKCSPLLKDGKCYTGVCHIRESQLLKKCIWSRWMNQLAGEYIDLYSYISTSLWRTIALP